MENGDIFNRMKRPTMRQVAFLQDLTGEPKKHGASTKIAKKYNVTTGTVSRFFQNCQKSGYLDENSELTEKGKQWLDYYVNIQKNLEEYFRNLGIPEEDIPSNVTVMAEQMDIHVLKSILVESKRKKQHEPENKFRESDIRHICLENRLERGDYPVEFAVLKYGRSSNIECELSMADRGFEKPAQLIHEGENSFLEMTPCEMQAISRMDGEVKSGHLSSLSYIADGIVKKAEVTADGRIRIPLTACTCHVRSESRLTCMIPINVTCSVGRVHMPESTALLIFWL